MVEANIDSFMNMNMYSPSVPLYYTLYQGSKPKNSLHEDTLKMLGRTVKVTIALALASGLTRHGP